MLGLMAGSLANCCFVSRAGDGPCCCPGAGVLSGTPLCCLPIGCWCGSYSMLRGEPTSGTGSCMSQVSQLHGQLHNWALWAGWSATLTVKGNPWPASARRSMTPKCYFLFAGCSAPPAGPADAFCGFDAGRLLFPRGPQLLAPQHSERDLLRGAAVQGVGSWDGPAGRLWPTSTTSLPARSAVWLHPGDAHLQRGLPHKCESISLACF